MKRLAVALVIMAAPVQAADLKIISIDVEGGAATLYVTPEGRSLLIDTGWPAGRGAPRAAPGEPPVPASLSSAEQPVPWSLNFLKTLWNAVVGRQPMSCFGLWRRHVAVMPAF